MDTKRIKGYRVYNLSMAGSDIVPLKKSVENIIEKGDLKLLIICLDEYVLQEQGYADIKMLDKLRMSSVGSLFSIKYYFKKIFPSNNHVWSSWGYLDTNSSSANSTKEINKAVSYLKSVPSNTKFESKLLLLLSETIKMARDDGVRIVAYFHPKPKRMFEYINNDSYKNYKQQIDDLFNLDKDIVIDFNTNKYDYIRDVDDTYIDGGHLSKKGGDRILEVLNNAL